MSHNTKPPCHHSEVIRRGERRMELIEAPGVDVKQSDTQTDADQLQPAQMKRKQRLYFVCHEKINASCVSSLILSCFNKNPFSCSYGEKKIFCVLAL